MSRVVLVSNRVAETGTKGQAGGMAVAIADIMATRDCLWFGWGGTTVKTDDKVADAPVFTDQCSRSQSAVTALTESEYRDYYLGYSNSVLWPVFHNRLDLAQFDAGFYPEYRRVNKRWAALLKTMLRPDDVIWVHDYHLVPLALELRALGVANTIGFFLHIPVPPAQSFLAIPEHVDLAHALAAYDLVGLQTQQDVGNMISFFQQAVYGQLLSDGRIRVGNRLVRLASFPVGIVLDVFRDDTTKHNAAPIDRVPQHRIIGIDRLDYTKGLPQKFRGFGHFLEKYPEYRRKVVLSQIAPPTRESLEAYTDIRLELQALSGEINGAYGDLDWVPIHYIYRGLSRSKLRDIYRTARIGLVTPLRDGMNLVAKEYVAAQDANDPGVLLLSRFTGAAEKMSSALLINPYNVADIADAIKAALEMSLEERKQRHAVLMAVLEEENAAPWGRAFLQTLEASGAPKADDQVREMRMKPDGVHRAAGPSTIGNNFQNVSISPFGKH